MIAKSNWTVGRRSYAAAYTLAFAVVSLIAVGAVGSVLGDDAEPQPKLDHADTPFATDADRNEGGRLVSVSTPAEPRNSVPDTPSNRAKTKILWHICARYDAHGCQSSDL